MEWRPVGWSACLPLLIFPCTIKSRSSLLAPAHPGGPGKRAFMLESHSWKLAQGRWTKVKLTGVEPVTAWSRFHCVTRLGWLWVWGGEKARTLNVWGRKTRACRQGAIDGCSCAAVDSSTSRLTSHTSRTAARVIFLITTLWCSSSYHAHDLNTRTVHRVNGYTSRCSTWYYRHPCSCLTAALFSWTTPSWAWLHNRQLLGTVRVDFYRSDEFPVIKPTVSNNWTEHHRFQKTKHSLLKTAIKTSMRIFYIVVYCSVNWRTVLKHNYKRLEVWILLLR